MAKRTSHRPATRGSVNNEILSTLISGDKYGYEIIKEVEEKTNGKVKLKQPSLYSSLNRFESKGFVSSYWEDSDIGGKRHYYSLTQTGKKFYEENVLKASDDFDEEIEEEKSENVIMPEVENIDSQSISSSYEIDTYEDNGERYLSNSKIANYGDIDVSNKVSDLLTEDDIAGKDAVEDITTATNIAITNENHTDDILKDENIENKDIEENNYNNNMIKEENYIDDNLEEENHSEKLQNIYDEISSEQNKIKALDCEDEPIRFPFHEAKHTPLSILDQQKRRESMEKLYGSQTNLFVEETPNDKINNESEKVDLESLNKVKEENLFVVKENDLDNIDEKKSVPMYAENGFNFDKYEESKREQKEPQENKKRFIMDENGIIKIDYGNENKKSAPRIIDNVGYRTNNTGNNVVDYKQPSPFKRQETKSNVFSRELTDEERVIKTQNFNQKFEDLTKEKMATKSDVDYKHILGELYSTEDGKYEKEQPSNNVYGYDIKNEDNSSDSEINNNYLNNQDYNINNDTENKFNDFNQIDKKKSDENEFVLSNKSHFMLGFAIAMAMIFETTLLMLILKTTNLLFNADYFLYIIGYSIAVIILVSTLIPYLINKNKRKLNNFKLSYSLMFGILGFLILCVITYGVNTILGMTLVNLTNYLSKLILPIVLSFNLILMPVMYKIIIMNKNMY